MKQNIARKMDKLIYQNPKTGKPSSVILRDIEIYGDRFHFYVDNEIDAYIAAYQYRLHKGEVIIEYSSVTEKWAVSVRETSS